MLPQPRRTKYRKQQKGRNTGVATSGHSVVFGDFGLKSLNNADLSYRQLEAARRVMSRQLKKVGKIWFRIFPDTPRTKKPAEVRMGNGKGSVEFYAARVRPGTIILEISGVSEEAARELFRKASAKLPVQTIMVSREIGA